MMHCINIENLAMTQRTDVFMRIFRLGSKYYGVKINGIYLLEGDTDNGDEYPSVVKTCNSKFGVAFQKRVTEMRADIDGDVKTMMLYDGSIASEGLGDGGVIKFGKGGGGREISFLFGSVDENMSINALEFEPQTIGIAKG